MVARRAAGPAGPFELSTQMLGPLPVIDWF
jgi:hypothetical protein